jgi:hypothetical protein
MLKVVSHKDERSKEVVKRFCDQVFMLRSVRHMYEELFEKEDSYAIMENTASSFFWHLNTILQNYLLLEFAKISDRAMTRKNENLTVDNLVLSIDWPQHIQERLRSLSEKTEDFRSYVLEARHKLLAHTDKATFLAQKTLGVFPEGKDEEFLKALEEICDIAHEACFGCIFGDMVVSGPGDVIDLKRTLINGLAFKQLLDESKGQERARLSFVLDKVKKLKP